MCSFSSDSVVSKHPWAWVGRHWGKKAADVSSRVHSLETQGLECLSPEAQAYKPEENSSFVF